MELKWLLRQEINNAHESDLARNTKKIPGTRRTASSAALISILCAKTNLFSCTFKDLENRQANTSRAIHRHNNTILRCDTQAFGQTLTFWHGAWRQAYAPH
jgi:hypothetical protein